MKRPLYGTIFASFILIMSLIGCGYHMTPEFSTVRYEVSGDAQNVNITAVTDEYGTVQTYSNVSLPWTFEYENITQEMFPPIYLYIEAKPAPIAIGTTDAILIDHLLDSSPSTDFVVSGVQVGDFTVKPGGQYSSITVVTSNDLTLIIGGTDPFTTGSDPYEIYPNTNRSLTGKAYGDNELLENLNLQSWYTMGATIIARNYTAP